MILRCPSPLTRLFLSDVVLIAIFSVLLGQLPLELVLLLQAAPQRTCSELRPRCHAKSACSASSTNGDFLCLLSTSSVFTYEQAGSLSSTPACRRHHLRHRLRLVRPNKLPAFFG
jgi:hypothetical protein